MSDDEMWTRPRAGRSSDGSAQARLRAEDAFYAAHGGAGARLVHRIVRALSVARRPRARRPIYISKEGE